MGLGFGELVLILLIVVLLFGATRLPALGKGLGEAIRGFKDSFKGEAPPPVEARKDLPRDAGSK